MIKIINFKYIKIIKNIFEFLILFLSLLLYFTSVWINKTYENMTLNEILFHILSPIKGTEKTILNNFFKKSLVPSIFLSLLIFNIFLLIEQKFIKNKDFILKIEIFNFHNILKIFERKKEYIIKLNILKRKLVFKIKRKFILFITIILKLAIIFFCLKTSFNILNLDQYINFLNKKSDFIEKNYVDPKKISLIFPKEKQNLIYIFVESLESSYFSKKLGGAEKENLLEPITDLVENGINFSNSNNFGGAYQTFGSNFTTAGIVSQTLGIPLKIKDKIVNYSHSHSSFFKNVYGLGNILENEGYNQLFLIGSDKKFGNRDILMKDHGNFKIFDYESAIEEKYIKKGYRKWWGFEDKKLFKIAKKKLLKLEDKNKPFNLTILTANTHFPDGYIEEKYKRKFKDRYSDAIFCSCQQIKKFVEWVQKQKCYKKTTIIISGDHLSMDKTHFLNFDKNYKRTIFNLFLNSKVKPSNTKNRSFTPFDMFPSTLASMGVKIKGERLGLGTNLFSNTSTLAEKYGIDYINDELKKQSIFYNFFYM